jgi:integrase
MPADQRGSVYKTSGGYGLRWYEETGRRRRKAGFRSKSEARGWFRDVELKRMRGEAVARPPVTLGEHVDRFLAVHAATRDPNTIRVLRERLKGPVEVFGDVPLRDLERMAADIAEWQTTLPARSRYGITQAFRQALEVAVRWGDLDRNPAKLAGANPPPPPRGIQTFTLGEVDMIAVELGPTLGPMIQFAAATGMRPEELLALEREDIDRDGGVARVARTHVRGRTKAYGKTSASRRDVPLSARAVAALDAVPPRIDTRLVFAAPSGGDVGLDNFRRRDWKPALEAAGIPHRRIYDLRSTFASHALAAGVSVFELARIMGDARPHEAHYGALLQGSAEAIRQRLDALDDRLGQDRATAAPASDETAE